MLKNHFSFISLLALLLISCSKADLSEPTQELPVGNERVVFHSDASLESRIQLHESNMQIVGVNSDDLNVVDPVTLLATVSAPNYDGIQMQASHVDVVGNRVFVGYTSGNQAFQGALDVLNISNPRRPRSVAAVLYPQFNVHALEVANGKLFVSGTGNPSSFTPAVTTAESGAFGFQELNGSGRPETDFTVQRVGGFAGTNIRVENDLIYLLTGNNGKIFIYNNQLQLQQQHVVDDGRGLAVSSQNNRLAILTGNGKIMMSGLQQIQQQTVLHIPHDRAAVKRTMDFMGDRLLVAGGSNGLVVYGDGNNIPAVTLQQFPLPTRPAGQSIENWETRSVSFNESNNLVVTANGTSGLWVFRRNAQTNELSLIGKVATTGSFNFVKSRGNIIVAATNEGFSIFRVNI